MRDTVLLSHSLPRRLSACSLFTYVPAKLGEHKGYVSRQLGKHLLSRTLTLTPNSDPHAHPHPNTHPHPSPHPNPHPHPHPNPNQASTAARTSRTSARTRCASSTGGEPSVVSLACRGHCCSVARCQALGVESDGVARRTRCRFSPAQPELPCARARVARARKPAPGAGETRVRVSKRYECI